MRKTEALREKSLVEIEGKSEWVKRKESGRYTDRNRERGGCG